MTDPKKTIDDLLRLAYLRGFQASREGYNQEHPFEDTNPEDHPNWVAKRDTALAELHALTSPPEQAAVTDDRSTLDRPATVEYPTGLLRWRKRENPSPVDAFFAPYTLQQEFVIRDAGKSECREWRDVPEVKK